MKVCNCIMGCRACGSCCQDGHTSSCPMFGGDALPALPTVPQPSTAAFNFKSAGIQVAVNREEGRTVGTFSDEVTVRRWIREQPDPAAWTAMRLENPNG